ncbi:MAG: type II restriction endonuclease, partial [Bacilli bacterium]|nr:type II restriction endonuclease [Bacilli bacterium]
YVNFDKVYKGVEKYKIELNILNSLIGSKNIEDDFEEIVSKYPEILKCIPLLLAVRRNEIYVLEGDDEYKYNFEKQNYDIKQYKVFMRKTGLFDLIANHIINNLVDYALGVETGLDSNGRKNRGGKAMEKLVEKHIKLTGVEYYKQMRLKDIETNWNVDLSRLSNMGKVTKRFDFVVKTSSKIFAIETNFYQGSGGGSKLNETARSYKMIALETKKIDKFDFVWITDGTAWNTAKNNLEETYDVLDAIYNLNDLEEGVLDKLFNTKLD